MAHEFPKRLLVGFYNGGNNRDHYQPTHIYTSQDGGESFEVAEDFEDLDNKAIHFFKFSSDGESIFVAPTCGSILKVKNPY